MKSPAPKFKVGQTVFCVDDPVEIVEGKIIRIAFNKDSPEHTMYELEKESKIRHHKIFYQHFVHESKIDAIKQMMPYVIDLVKTAHEYNMIAEKATDQMKDMLNK